MLSLQEARERIFAALHPALESERLPLLQAVGRFVAEEVRAAVDNPAFTNSAMDGYAFNVADAGRHAYRLPLEGESACGSAPATLRAGTAMRIFTGAPLPLGADAVAMQEDVRIVDGEAQLPDKIAAGENLRYVGEDFRRGELLYRPGQRLSSFDLALLSSAGIAEVPVYRRARVLVIATGNELVPPGKPLEPGQIYESNRLATLLQVEALGAEAIDGGTVGDDAGALRARLEQSTNFDFVITSGGASVGDHDLVKQIFAEIGEINLWRIKIKPGKPLAFGRLGARGHFFALPGNPVSSLVTFKLFVEPALIAWNHGKIESLALKAIAANAFRRQPGRMEFLRARLYDEGGSLRAHALRGQGSHMLGPLRETNAFIRLAEDSNGFAEGDLVDVIPLRLNT